MKKHYQFFNHQQCEFFPCHKVEKPDEFNCLFCYCPLYGLGEECGGNYKYTNGKKDCSDCIIPHGENGYAHVMSKIKKVIELGSKKNSL